MTLSELFNFNLSEKRRAQPALNREGMTFDEWYRGEDPTEYGVE
jgi:hypothetical protein